MPFDHCLVFGTYCYLLSRNVIGVYFDIIVLT